MRISTLALAATLCWPPLVAVAQGVATTAAAIIPVGPRLTLTEALAQAEAANPVMRAKQAQLSGAQGTASDAAALLANNPQVNLGLTRRMAPSAAGSERRAEWTAGLAQTFEVAGQPGHRRRAAMAALEALQLEIQAIRSQQHSEVGQRFYRVLALQRRVEIEAQATGLLDETSRLVERRRAAGEDTRLDANVALVEAERARNQLATVREQLIEARSALAVPLQLPPEVLPEVIGQLEPALLPYGEAELLQSAQAQPRLQALAARQQSAQARLRLERAARYPDVTVGVNVGREGSAEARERLTTLTLSLPLPLFKRNAAGIGTAATEAEQASIERQAADRDTPAQIRALWARLDSLRQRVARLQQSVVPALASNEQLSAKSLRAGQIGLLELIVTNRQTLDARRELVDALLDYQTTRLALEAAAGWNVQP